MKTDPEKPHENALINLWIYETYANDVFMKRVQTMYSWNFCPFCKRCIREIYRNDVFMNLLQTVLSWNLCKRCFHETYANNVFMKLMQTMYSWNLCKRCFHKTYAKDLFGKLKQMIVHVFINANNHLLYLKNYASWNTLVALDKVHARMVIG